MDIFFQLWLWLLTVVLLSPVVYIGAVVFWMQIGRGVERLLDWWEPPPPPYCDIDPLCHPHFCWASDRSGWIGSVRVVPPRSEPCNT